MISCPIPRAPTCGPSWWALNDAVVQALGSALAGLARRPALAMLLADAVRQRRDSTPFLMPDLQAQLLDLLAACGFTPVYGGGQGAAFQNSGPITIAEIPGRTGHYLRNELARTIGHGVPGIAAGNLEISLSQGVERLAFAPDQAASRSDYVGSATWTLKAPNGTVLATGDVRERASFNFADAAYWTVAQLVAHHTVNGCALAAGDLFGSGTLFPAWTFDATVQYNASIDRPVRSIVAARYQPGPFQTLSGTYRYARDLNEQFELGWQWPIYRGDARPVGASSGCGGTLYGVGRVNYSMRDSRVTDSLAGLEYDAGCWIGRFVVQKVSTGLSESTTHWMLQLELIGLSRLGTSLAVGVGAYALALAALDASHRSRT